MTTAALVLFAAALAIVLPSLLVRARAWFLAANAAVDQMVADALNDGEAS